MVNRSTELRTTRFRILTDRAGSEPRFRPASLALVEPDERGDPMSPLRWTTKSTRNLAAEPTSQGHRVSADTVMTRRSPDGTLEPELPSGR